MIARRSVLVSAVIALVPTALFGASVHDVIRSAEGSGKRVSYRGMKTATVHSSRGPSTSTLKVLHIKPNLTRAEYFSPASLAGMIVIQDGKDLWKFDPGEDAWERLSPGLQLSADVVRPDAFDNYELRLLGSDTVAGRPTYVVQAAPRRSGDSARKLWIDKQFYLVMATQVNSASGRIVNSSRYTSIDFNPGDISRSAFKITGKVKRPSTSSEAAFKPLRPSYVPKGYRLLGSSWMVVNGHLCAHLQFSNGANTISLFQRTSGGSQPNPASRGSFTNVITWTRSGIAFTLIGSLAESELEKMAQSVK